MKKALIIGGAGFVGKYLAEYLVGDCGYTVVSTKMKNEVLDADGYEVVDMNLLVKEEVEAVLRESNPDYVFHLAAQSSVAVSWSNPQLTVDVNIKGTLNLLDVCKEIEYKGNVLLIGSGEEYGRIDPDQVPITEDTVLRPGNIYAATKGCQNMLATIYAKAYNLNLIMVRAFNHVGPRQSPQFVVADFCKQVVEVEKGLREPVIHVGNLKAKRDFTDVRDVVAAYECLVRQGKAGETYNVGAGNAYEIQEILDKIIALSGKDIKVEVEKERLRPIDVPIISADITKITEQTDWERKISLEQTLIDTLDYWRENIEA
nr:GDP-mannose 4,6-dehydratase [Eubacterium sp.]